MRKVLNLHVISLLLLYGIAEKSSARSATTVEEPDLTELEETGERTKLIINPLNPRSYHFTHQGPIAYKSTSFLELVSYGHLTIDKTLLIKQVVLNHADTIFITCPRKWGKTTNLRMIESYLDKEIGEGNITRTRENATNYNFFQNGALLNGQNWTGMFLISKYVEITEEYLCRWPVVYVDFSNMEPYFDYSTFRKLLLQEIEKAYDKFYDVLWAYCKDVSSMNSNEQGDDSNEQADDSNEQAHDSNEQAHDSNEQADDSNEQADNYGCSSSREIIEELLTYDWADSRLNDTFIIESLYLLTKTLGEWYSVKVFVLVDGYDSPLYHVLMNPDFKEKDRMPTFKLYKKMLEKLLIGNRYIKKSILTGTFRFKEDKLFPEMKNFFAYNFLKDSIFYYYGINQVDLESICTYMNLPFETKSEIQRWYGGFSAGGHLQSPIKISNLGSVARYLSHKRFQCYWKEYVVYWEKLLRQLIKTTGFFVEIGNLIRGEKTQIRTRDITFSVKDLDTIMSIKGKSSEEEILAVELTMKFLLVVGYLVPTDGPCRTCLYLRIPNLEIRNVLENLSPSLRFSRNRVGTFYDSGINNETVQSPS